MVLVSSFAPRTPLSKWGNISTASMVYQRESLVLWPDAYRYACRIAFREYAVLKDLADLGRRVRVLDSLPRLPWSAYIGVCGMPGTPSLCFP